MQRIRFLWRCKIPLIPPLPKGGEGGFPRRKRVNRSGCVTGTPLRAGPAICLSLAALIFLAWPFGGHAQAPLREDPEKVLGFAHHLLSDGDHYRAISEYQAFLFLFPRHPRMEEASFFLGKAYQLDGQWKEALEVFLRVAQGGAGGSPWARDAALEYGETLLKTGQPIHAARALEEAAGNPPWKSIRGKALYRAAWSWMQAREWQEALRVLEEIPQEDPLHAHAEGMKAQIMEEVPALPRRNPWVAGGLAALLPGSGHLYVGRLKDAATSFLLNGAFIAGAALAVRKGYPITGGIVSFFELGWYLGGISTAASGAEQFTRDQETQWLEKLGQRWELPSRAGDSRGTEALLRWEWRF